MKTLYTYLLRQIITSLLMTLVVFTGVFLLGNLLNEILGLLVKHNVSFGVIVEALGLLIPFVLIYALPMGLLTATLLVFGRLSADNELTAARAGGISLVSLVLPVLLLSVLLSGVSAYVNLYFGPACRMAYKNLIYPYLAQLVTTQLPEGVFIKEFPGYIIHIGRNDGGQLRDVMLAEQKEGTNTFLVRAERGALTVDPTNQSIIITLYDGPYIRNVEGREIVGKLSQWSMKLDYGKIMQVQKKARITDYTFDQLRDELHLLEAQLNQTLTATNLTPGELQERAAFRQKQIEEFVSPLKVQMHRQVSFSFACIAFTLVGIPLSIRAHRRETVASFALALVLVVVYYSFLMAGESLARRPEFYPHLIVWIPNFIFQGVGAVLLWRANRGI